MKERASMEAVRKREPIGRGRDIESKRHSKAAEEQKSQSGVSSTGQERRRARKEGL